MPIGKRSRSRQTTSGRILTNWKWWGLIALLILVPSPLPGGQENDLLNIRNGALVLSATGHYGGRWNAVSLLDGTYASGWSSVKDNPYPNTFVIELAQQYSLTSFAMDTTGAAELTLPGISVRDFELYGSTTSGKEDFYLILSGEADRGRRKIFLLEKPIEARWLKLVILSNWGNTSHAELMELEAYGEPVGDVPLQRPFHGIYKTNYGLMRLEQRGSLIAGCYEIDNGRLAGSTDGRVLKFRWWEDGPLSGVALMVLSADGNFMNGLWYERGQPKGVWYGNRVTDGRMPKCEVPPEFFTAVSMEETGVSKPVEETSLRKSIDKKPGPTGLYDIYFDSDSAAITPEFEAKLLENFRVLQILPSQKIIVEGHTDSTHTRKYNLGLSQRRAQAVVEWLIENGIEADRLEAKGYGESRPAANNSTPEGKALNRRVEIKPQ